MFNSILKFHKNEIPFDQKKLVGILKPVIENYKLDLLVLFGSFSRGDIWGGSDLDLGFWSKSRLPYDQLDNLIYDVINLTAFEKVNLIDLYFDSSEKVAELAEIQSKYGTELSVLQLSIYNTGKLLFESKHGLFEEKKVFANKQSKFFGNDLKELIVKDKINHIKELATQLSNLESDRIENSLNLPLELILRSKIGGYLGFAKIQLTSDIANKIFKLNKFILREYYNIVVKNRIESVNKLLEHHSFDKEKMIFFSKLMNFESIINNDYYYGPGYAIEHYSQLLRFNLDYYFKIIEKVTSPDRLIK